MKLHFWGASQTVTGSRYWLEHGGDNVLIDCGLFQGLKDLRLKNWAPFPIDPAKIKAVVLTHAHLDHSGYLPLLIKNGFKGSIYATAATRELCRILLLDSAYLQEEEAKFANRRGFSKHKPALPLYTRPDAEAAMAYFVDVPFHVNHKISEQFQASFFEAGHLLGAASLRLSTSRGSILFSGDLGRQNDPIMKPPEHPPAADVLVVESTYGNRLHEEVDPMVQLRDIIVRTVKRGGTVVIPSFAVGRAQLLLYYLHKLLEQKAIPPIPIYLNSPMANSVNAIFRKFAGEHKLDLEEAQSVCQTARIVSTPDESRALNDDREPKIIVASSGMATGGRILHHLKSFAPDSANSIVFAGFQAAGTRGEALVNGADKIKIHGEYWPIRAEVFNLESLSAHADASEILDWVKGMKVKPKRIFVTHGEPNASLALADKLKAEMGVPVEIPNIMSEFEI